MLEDLRKRIAQSASEIKQPEIFPWTRWIKSPNVEKKKIERLRLAHLNTDEVVLVIEKSPINDITSPLFGNGIIPRATDYQIPHSKCSIIFFNFGRSRTINIDIVYNEAGKIYFSARSNKSDNLVYWNTQLWNEKPKIITETQADFEIQFILTSFVADTSKLKYLIKSYPSPVSSFDPMQTNQSNLKNVDFQIYYPEILDPESKISTQIRDAIEFDFAAPAIINALSEIIPEIYNVELLIESFAPAEEQVVKLFNQDKARPNIYRIKLLGENETRIKKFFLKNIPLQKKGVWGHFPIFFDKPQVFDKEYFIENDPTEIIFTNSENETIDEFNEVGKKLNNIISNILNPNISVISDESELKIYDHTRTGKEFLLQNRIALLADELGINKKLQALLALKELFNQGEIKNVLIIANEDEIGFNGSTPIECELWIEKIEKIFPGIQTALFSQIGDNYELLHPSPITIIDHDSLLEILSHNGNNNIAIGNFDAVIFDDIEILLKELSNATAFVKKTNPKYFWALSHLPLNKNKDIFIRVFEMLEIVEPEINCLRREFENVEKELNSNMEINYLIKSDTQQRVEYLELLETGIKELVEFQVSGNPYRFHANVFTLLHQLMRVNNFSTKSETSNKAQFLISILNKIITSNKNVIVLVMDEKYAAPKIEALLKTENIGYTSFYNSRSPEELKTSIENFTSQSGKNVFLTGIKSIKGKLKLPTTDYLIYFDKWWNPASMWQLETSIFSKRVTKDQNLYFSRILLHTENSLDTIIQPEIAAKGFYAETLFEAIQPEIINEVFNDIDWMRILSSHAEQLGLEPERDLQTELDNEEISKNAIAEMSSNIPDLSKDEALSLVKNFIIRLNYTNIKIRVSGDENLFEIQGFNNKNARYNQIYSVVLFKEFEDTEDLMRVLQNKILDNPGLKIAVFLLYKDSYKTEIKDTQRISIITLETLAVFLHHLKIY